MTLKNTAQQILNECLALRERALSWSVGNIDQLRSILAQSITLVAQAEDLLVVNTSSDARLAQVVLDLATVISELVSATSKLNSIDVNVADIETVAGTLAATTTTISGLVTTSNGLLSTANGLLGTGNGLLTTIESSNVAIAAAVATIGTTTLITTNTILGNIDTKLAGTLTTSDATTQSTLSTISGQLNTINGNINYIVTNTGNIVTNTNSILSLTYSSYRIEECLNYQIAVAASVTPTRTNMLVETWYEKVTGVGFTEVKLVENTGSTVIRATVTLSCTTYATGAYTDSAYNSGTLGIWGVLHKKIHSVANAVTGVWSSSSYTITDYSPSSYSWPTGSWYGRTTAYLSSYPSATSILGDLVEYVQLSRASKTIDVYPGEFIVLTATSGAGFIRVDVSTVEYG
jgi:hypothetical protein